MPTIAKAYVQIIPSAEGIKGSITKLLGGEVDKAGDAAGGSFAGKFVKSIGKAVAAAGIGAAISKAVSSSLSEGAALQQSMGGVETLFKASADKVFANANKAFETTGLSANAYMESVTGFAASLLASLGGDTEKAADAANMAMISMADNSNKMGTSMEAIQNAYSGFAKQNYTMLDNLKLGYGGTKTEMERLLKDAKKISGVEYNIDNLSDVYEAIHVIQTDLGITGTTAKEASVTFSGSFAAMKASAQNLLGALAMDGFDVGLYLNNFLGTVKTFLVGNFLPMVGNVFKGMGKLFVEAIKAFKTAIPNILETGRGIVTNLITSITQNLPGLIEKGKDIAGSIITGITEKLPDIRLKAIDMLTNFLKQINQTLPAVLAQGRSILYSITSGIAEKAPEMATSAFDMLAKFSGKIFELLPEILSLGASILGNIVAGIVENFPNIATAAWDMLVAFVSKIAENFPSILDQGKAIISNIVSGIADALPDIEQGAKDTMAGLLLKINETFQSFIDAGKNIVGKIIDGIKGKLTDAKNGISEIASGLLTKISEKYEAFKGRGKAIINNIINGIKEKISDIASIPQQIYNTLKDAVTNIDFGQIGKDIMNGIKGGITSMAGSVKDAAVGAAKSIAGGIRGFFQINSPSHLMRDVVGKGIMEGIEVGMDERTPQTVNTAINDMGKINTALQKTAVSPSVNNSEDVASKVAAAVVRGMSSAKISISERSFKRGLEGMGVAFS